MEMVYSKPATSPAKHLSYQISTNISKSIRVHATDIKEYIQLAYNSFTPNYSKTAKNMTIRKTTQPPKYSKVSELIQSINWINLPVAPVSRSGFKDKTIIYQHKDIQQECYNLRLYSFKAPAVIVVIYVRKKTATKLLFSVHSTNGYIILKNQLSS